MTGYCPCSDLYTTFCPCRGGSSDGGARDESRRVLAVATGLTEQEIIEVGDVPPLCATCSHPEVVHGGFARRGSACAYRHCTCTEYVAGGAS